MDVLSRQSAVLKSRFLEASAGTGKTFAIEQLIARFIVEGGFKLEEILAVTFTRAAARDMRTRIRTNLEKIEELAPDYLKALYEEGKEFEAKERLRQALICFDEAQIFTIHGFCKRMLSEFAFEAHAALERNDSNGHALMKEVVQDFLREQISSVEEAEGLLKESRQNLDTLIERIIHGIQNPKQASPLVRKIADACRPLWNERRRAEEVYTPDALLETMEEALSRPLFIEKVRAKYRAAIVDEFQDTDPLSWKIFERIFLEDSSKIVYLVGDPKQSIYGFRSADVYTYMRAGEKLGKDSRVYLTTNYRSQPKLVEALNQLFIGSDWMQLPGLPGALTYIPVSAGRSCGKLEEESPIHFFLAQSSPSRERSWPTKQLEREKLFPYIANELMRLHQERNIPWAEMAILVKDRFQAQRLQEFFSTLSIPASIKRTLNLAETEGFCAFEKLLSAALHPEDQSAVQNALIEPLFEKEVSFRELYKTLMQRGFPAFYQELVELGLLVDDAVRQTAEILLEATCPPQHLLKLMRELKKTDPEEEERLKLRGEEAHDKVAIMTLFASKGLEFDIVFALGLASRHSSEETAEQDAEKMRQLYVACTRAREKLYIPLILGSSGRVSASAIELFWQRRFKKQIDLKDLEGFSGITFSWADGKTPPPLINEEPVQEADFDEQVPLPSFPKQFLSSFSSLSKKTALHIAKDVQGIPAGAETGTLVHAVLERLFREGKYHCRDLAALQHIIKETLAKTHLEAWSKAVEEMVVQALNLPLFGEFCLKDLPRHQVTTELEFLYSDGNSLIKGFVDLFFCYKDQYYVLDWKTNWLSPEISLKQCMEENDYFLQAALYKEATQRYVKLFDNRPVAGAIYLFLRGPSVYYVTHEEMALSLAAR